MPDRSFQWATRSRPFGRSRMALAKEVRPGADY
jgi:hypothetical protein